MPGEAQSSAEDASRSLAKGRRGVWLDTTFWKRGCCLEREDKKIIKETRVHAKRHTLGLERRLSG